MASELNSLQAGTLRHEHDISGATGMPITHEPHPRQEPTMLSQTTALSALVLAGTLALTGCSASTAPEVGPEKIAQSVESTPSAELTPTPTQPADPLEGKKSGDPIDEGLAASINAEWSGLADDKAYQLPDGTFVLIKGGEPLPENVVSAAAHAVTPATQLAYQPGDFVAAHQEALNEAMQEQEERTGRGLVFVFHAVSAVPGSGISPSFEAQWFVGDKARYTGYSKEEAIAGAAAWVNKNPSTRALIVVDAVE